MDLKFRKKCLLQRAGCILHIVNCTRTEAQQWKEFCEYTISNKTFCDRDAW